MKKLGIMVLAYLGSTHATRLRWIDGQIDDDDDSFKVDTKGNVHSLMQTASASQSDPIWPSTGPSGLRQGEDKSPEQLLEEDLRARKPQEFTDEKETLNDTSDSISWAEKKTGNKLELPKKSDVEKKLEQMPALDPDSEEWTDDEDIRSTLKSAHQAEWLYGYHGYGPGNYSGGQDCDGYGNYTNGRGFGNGSYPQYNPWWGTYGNNPWWYWYRSNTYNHCGYGWAGYGSAAPALSKNVSAGNATVNTTDETVKGNTYNTIHHNGYHGYYGGYGHGYMHTHGHEGWRCKKPKNLDWWKHLEKDTGYEGMVPSNINERNRHFWVHKEYKHVADVYCDEWETPAWYIQQQELKKKQEEEAKKKAEEAAKNKTAGGNSTDAKGAEGGGGKKFVPPELQATAQENQPEQANANADPNIEVSGSNINFAEFGLGLADLKSEEDQSLTMISDQINLQESVSNQERLYEYMLRMNY